MAARRRWARFSVIAGSCFREVQCGKVYVRPDRKFIGPSMSELGQQHVSWHVSGWSAYGRRAALIRTWPAPLLVTQGSLTSLRERLVKIGAKIVTHARYVTFQMAEVAVPKELFEEILRLIGGLRPRPAPA